MASLLAAQAASIPLIEDGKPVVAIYVSPDEVRPDRITLKGKEREQPNLLARTLDDLNRHLEAMSGARLEIIAATDLSAIPARALVIGRLAAECGAVPAVSQWGEGYRIVGKDGRVLVAGENMPATVYGVYGLLNHLGCDWTMPGPLGEIIPRKSTVAVAEMDLASAPDFGLRWMWIGGGAKYLNAEQKAEFELWRVRQRLGAGEAVRSRIGEAHMWQILPKKYPEAFAKDPSMLALVRQPDGTYVRRGPQVETTHPQVVELAIRYIREKFEAEGWSKDKTVTVGLGPADGLDFSESPESIAAGSRRQDVMLGSPDATDLVVGLLNNVLERIGDEYPNLSLGFYVYSAHEEFPARVVPHARIHPIFAPINYSRYHSTIDSRSKSRAHYRSVVEQWADLSRKQGNPLMVYEYNWNLADNLLPFTRIRTMAEDLRYYHEQGLFGVTIQAIRASAINAAHDYLFAKMAWDTSLDWKQVLGDYCRAAFGPASADLERYYLRLIKRQQEAGEEAGSFYAAPLIFDGDFLRESRKDLEAAVATKGLSNAERARIEGVRFGLVNLESYLGWNAALADFDFIRAGAFVAAMQENFDKAMAANGHFFDYSGGIYLRKFLRLPTEEALKYASEPYRIAYKIPDQMPTMFDPSSSGTRLNLFGPEINDEGWVRTRTFSSTWDAQGLGLLRQGSVWYRTRFAMPEELKGGEGAGLFLMGFEDEARVWLNGRDLGTSGIKFGRPATWDLTDALLPGKENLLAIQVTRNSMANEIGLGGLLRPGFVFTGPRLVPTAPPAPGPHERVLPGGEVETVSTTEKK